MYWPCMLSISALHWGLQPRRSFPLSSALFDCICCGLCSFFQLGNLLHSKWIPAASGGITITSARLLVMAQYIVRLSSTCKLVCMMFETVDGGLISVFINQGKLKGHGRCLPAPQDCLLCMTGATSGRHERAAGNFGRQMLMQKGTEAARICGSYCPSAQLLRLILIFHFSWLA